MVGRMVPLDGHAGHPGAGAVPAARCQREGRFAPFPGGTSRRVGAEPSPYLHLAGATPMTFACGILLRPCEVVALLGAGEPAYARLANESDRRRGLAVARRSTR